MKPTISNKLKVKIIYKSVINKSNPGMPIEEYINIWLTAQTITIVDIQYSTINKEESVLISYTE